MSQRQDRRQAHRVLERLALSITDGGGALHAETQNLSTAGAYCTLDQWIAPMTKLQLDFELPTAPKSSRVRCGGVIVRVEPIVASADRGRFHIAIFFSEISERDRAAIAEFVRQRLAARPAL